MFNQKGEISSEELSRLSDRNILKRIKKHVSAGNTCFYHGSDGRSLLLSHGIFDRPHYIFPWPLSYLQKIVGVFTVTLTITEPHSVKTKEQIVFPWKDFKKAIKQFLSCVDDPLRIQYNNRSH